MMCLAKFPPGEDCFLNRCASFHSYSRKKILPFSPICVILDDTKGRKAMYDLPAARSKSFRACQHMFFVPDINDTRKIRKGLSHGKFKIRNIETSCPRPGHPFWEILRGRHPRLKTEFGAFLTTKSGDKVAKYFGISKYTLYSYVDINK